MGSFAGAGTARDVMNYWQTVLKANPEIWGDFLGQWRWEIAGSAGGRWDLRPQGKEKAISDSYDVTFFAEDSAVRELATGGANPQQMFHQGRLRIVGDVTGVVLVSHVLEKLIIWNDA